MTRITRSADCGNSPKNAKVQDIGLALEGAAGLDVNLLPGAVWHRADGVVLTGAEAIERALSGTAPTEVTVETAIAHGKVGCVAGRTVGADGQARRFCHVLTFATATAAALARIESYGTAG